MTPIKLADWQGEMEKRGKLDCKFVCASCGEKSSPNDFRALGADYQRAPQECIGRLRLEGIDVQRGCTWAAFGLLDICPVHLELPDGNKLVPVFAFAEES